MANKKLHISVWLNGEFRGYIKSVSYARKRFEVTGDITDAKGYVRHEIIQGDIDYCTLFGGVLGYTFTYE